MLVILTSLALAMAVAAVDDNVAASASEATASTSEKAKPDKSKRVCRTVVISGTRLGERYCRTKEDWDRDTEKARRNLEDAQLNGYRRDGEANTFGGVTQPPR